LSTEQSLTARQGGLPDRSIGHEGTFPGYFLNESLKKRDLPVMDIFARRRKPLCAPVLEGLECGHEAISSTLDGLVQPERIWIITHLISQGIEILSCDLPRLLVVR
jgi:hypothetical protein